MTGSNAQHRRKGSGINFVFPTQGEVAKGPANPVDGTTAEAAVARPAARTGVGLLATAAFEKQVLDERIERLTGEVAQLKTERGGQRMDPRLIVAGKWANRHPDAFSGEKFDAFKREIADAGGNVEAIKVRPLQGRRTDGEAKYEVVFGHRRHRACLELGIPVLIIVEDLDDSGMFVQMERENRGRENLSAYEQGRMYVRAIDEGLFSSIRSLASAIGRDFSDVGKAMRIARLPEEVIGAFPSAIDIQFRWATNLEKALANHADAVLTAARAASQASPKLAATDVFSRLTACLHSTKGVGPSHTSTKELRLGPGRKGRVLVDASGATRIELAPGVLPTDRWDQLEAVLVKLLG